MDASGCPGRKVFAYAKTMQFGKSFPAPFPLFPDDTSKSPSDPRIKPGQY